MAVRFGNVLFEPLWNNHYVDHIQITVAETVGVGGRGGYYDKSGAMRDMVQNHLMQLLCLIAMEPPSQFERRRRARREAEGDPRAPAGRRRTTSSAASTTPASGQASYREDVGNARSFTESFIAMKVAHRQLALGRRALLPAHRQAA